jgi:anti-sigma regulatory factor (Ser/Thr protein kinase)
VNHGDPPLLRVLRADASLLAGVSMGASLSALDTIPKTAADVRCTLESRPMSEYEAANFVGEPPTQQTPAERLALRRLEAALAEQARLGDVYARSVGTSAEQAAHARLQAASLKVSECDQLAKTVLNQPAETRGETGRARPRVILALGNALAFAVDGGAEAAADARAELDERLTPGLDPAVMQVVQLLLSELVNNCVLHGAARRPGAWIDIAVSIFPQALWVEVCDGGPSFRHQPSPPSTAARAGRGLYLVDQLSTRWGISESGRARVWFELQRAT